MVETPEETTGTYLYGVAYAEPLRNGQPQLESAPVGDGGGRVRTVESGNLAAVVSDAPVTQYETTRENLVAHETVLEEVMNRTDVLPVSFGIVATSDQEVKEQLLERESEVLHESLDYIRGRVELTLQVLWNEDALFRRIVEENPDIRQLRDSITGQPDDAVRDQKIQLGTLTAEAIQRTSQEEAQEILDALQPLVVETKVNENITDTMLLNAAFLADKDQLSAIDGKVNELGEAHADQMIFRYVGPLPPFDFVSIRLRWEE